MAATRVLSIDGGGIRGIIPAKVLVTFEQLLQKHSGRSEARIADYFDLIAGTSTGGILTAIYLLPEKNDPTKPKFSAQEALDFYLENGQTIFKNTFLHSIGSLFGLTGTKYSDKGLTKLLNDYYGDTKLGQLIKPCLITAYDVENNSTTFFNQLDTFERESKEFYVKDVIRATTAAPSYFSIAEISGLDGSMGYFIDGGVFANNPALCAYAEVSKLPDKETKKKELLILSLGTGSKEISYDYKKMNRWGMVRWIEPIFSISRTGVSEVVDYQLRIMYREAEKSKDYLRIQMEIDEKQKEAAKLDNVSPENLKVLEKMGEELTHKYFAELDEFARRLVQTVNLPSNQEQKLTKSKERMNRQVSARDLIKKKYIS
ncbi:MAG: patatin-like phospholipase family protein [Cellulosilyticaceae bacterium]